MIIIVILVSTINYAWEIRHFWEIDGLSGQRSALLALNSWQMQFRVYQSSWAAYPQCATERQNKYCQSSANLARWLLGLAHACLSVIKPAPWATAGCGQQAVGRPNGSNCGVMGFQQRLCEPKQRDLKWILISHALSYWTGRSAAAGLQEWRLSTQWLTTINYFCLCLFSSSFFPSHNITLSCCCFTYWRVHFQTQAEKK